VVSACVGSPIGSPELIAFAEYPNYENKTDDAGRQGGAVGGAWLGVLDGGRAAPG